MKKLKQYYKDVISDMETENKIKCEKIERKVE
jgi:hypothetical protein